MGWGSTAGGAPSGTSAACVGALLGAGWLALVGARLGAAPSAGGGVGRGIVAEGAEAVGAVDATGPETWVTTGGAGTRLLWWWATMTSMATAPAGRASTRPAVIASGLENLIVRGLDSSGNARWRGGGAGG